MNSPPTDRMRLHKGIESLRGAAIIDPDGFKEILMSSDGDILTAITLEVDQIILPRVLRFMNDKRDEIVLRVVSRRIIEVEHLSQNLAGAAAALLNNHEFKDPGSPESKLLATILEEFAANTKQLRLRTSLSQKGISVSSVGIPIAAIFSSIKCHRDSDARPDTLGVPDLVDACKPISTAYLMAQDGTIVTRNGNEDVLIHLEDLFLAGLSDCAAVASAPTGGTQAKTFRILGSGTNQDEAIVIAQDAGQTHYFKTSFQMALGVLSQQY